jgi:hypothetical protein
MAVRADAARDGRADEAEQRQRGERKHRCHTAVAVPGECPQQCLERHR